ncbi:hypothetical protein XAP3CFBP6996_009310 [Xanthomonas citri pv. fuscans CFBP 6996]|uniref:Uncharacterized protein n=1 Tax=Xanthomonas citri pv. phaseoli var. fuscans TaxID=473423 RepID=A0A808FML9_XANCI|nr:hypothetical protein XAP3CFBP6996_009310 [Xanthomonas citri pv. fuscans CFBP 6996]QWN05775.1 hypothetical protein DGN16_09110 [Xanthomonas citri pv. fuscans]QWN10000.1 hypothetical protein DGN11_14460 [Xanthomonas citri pv. fuscans]QWN14164.1 hypothetical protein DGN07_09135 [Xanthomonas citri pv. fuscans]QWN18470.1 hypothetical protein DGN02_09405 [Xanthomonas citri]
MTSLGISRRERPSHRHFPARTTLWFATMPPRLRAHPMEDDPIPPCCRPARAPAGSPSAPPPSPSLTGEDARG